MKKVLIILISILAAFSLSGCSNIEEEPYIIIEPDITRQSLEYYQEGNYYKNLVEYKDSDVYFRVFNLYNPIGEDEIDPFDSYSNPELSSYAFQIVTDSNFVIEFESIEGSYKIGNVPGGYTNISDTLINHQLISGNVYGETVQVTLYIDTVEVFTDSFTFNPYALPSILDGYAIYEIDRLPFIYYLIISLVVVGVYIVSFYLYRRIYEKDLNDSLMKNRKFKLIDLNIYAIITAIITIVLIISLSFICRNSYDNKVYNNVHVSNVVRLTGFYDNEYDDLQIDLANLFVESVVVREVDGELLTYPTYSNIHEINIDYLQIRDEITDLIRYGENVSICGGTEDSDLACVLLGPLPSIIITLSDGENTIKVMFDKTYAVYGATEAVYVEVYTDEYVYRYNFAAELMQTEFDTIYNYINQEFLDYYASIE